MSAGINIPYSSPGIFEYKIVLGVAPYIMGCFEVLGDAPDQPHLHQLWRLDICKCSCMLVTLLTQGLGTRGAVAVAENDHKALRLETYCGAHPEPQQDKHALKQGVVSKGTWMRQAL